MRFHIAALPHTSTTMAYGSCAYTEKVRKFSNAMTALGHEVYLYGGAENNANVKEFISCMSKPLADEMLDGVHYTQVTAYGPFWEIFNDKVIKEMKKRAEKHDFILLSFGDSQKKVADAFPAHIVVEYGIGYGGSFTKYRSFESQAWQHATYAAQAGNPHKADGNWWHAVIPGFFEPDQFPEINEPREDYLLFVGRVIERKGIKVVQDVAQRTGKKLIVAGHCEGPPPAGCEYIGEVGPDVRLHLMSKARALIAPTLYIEPFGNVVIEAQACGTPTITTDWGAFTETVSHGINGFRCHTLKEFSDAVEAAEGLSPRVIRDLAFSRYSAPVVAQQYTKYFERLATLWDKGWNQ